MPIPSNWQLSKLSCWLRQLFLRYPLLSRRPWRTPWGPLWPKRVRRRVVSSFDLKFRYYLDLGTSKFKSHTYYLFVPISLMVETLKSNFFFTFNVWIAEILNIIKILLQFCIFFEIIWWILNMIKMDLVQF